MNQPGNRKTPSLLAGLVSVMLAACASPAAPMVATPEPTPDIGAEYLQVAAIYNDAVDTWIGGNHGDLVWLKDFGRRMALATRTVEERLVAFPMPSELEDVCDELIEAEAAAHIEFLYMANAETIEGAHDHLAAALEGYADAALYSEVIRVHLGLPSVEIDPFHYL